MVKIKEIDASAVREAINIRDVIRAPSRHTRPG